MTDPTSDRRARGRRRTLVAVPIVAALLAGAAVTWRLTGPDDRGPDGGVGVIPLVECLEGRGIDVPDELESGADPGALRRAVQEAGVDVRRAVVGCLATPDVRERVTSGLSRLDRVLGRAPGEPVFEGDFADPSAMTVDSVVYAYATNTAFANVPVGSASISQPGSLDDDALPQLPGWSEPGWVWAPAPLELGPGDHRLYYTTRHRERGRQCISVAVGTAPGGPFRDDSTEPLVCQFDEGGSIDPSPIVVDGVPYLVWKSDGNCCGRPTKLWSARLDAAGTALVTDPTELLRNDQAWEGDVIEAPSMFEADGAFVTLYSGNDWSNDDYGIGYAVCSSVAGPCTKPESGPLLASDDALSGPGGASVFTGANGDLHVVYHAWVDDAVGYENGGVRALFAEPLEMVDGRPVLPLRE